MTECWDSWWRTSANKTRTSHLCRFRVINKDRQAFHTYLHHTPPPPPHLPAQPPLPPPPLRRRKQTQMNLNIVPQDHERFSEATQDVTYPRPARWWRGGEKKRRLSQICSVHCEIFDYIYSLVLLFYVWHGWNKDKQTAVNDKLFKFLVPSEKKRKYHLSTDKQLMSFYNESVSI